MGSNMAEAHPVGFRWPMKAKEKGATLIHVDPHFSRTSAACDLYVPIRAGSDIAFLGGLINYVLTRELWFKEYVLAYTNASSIVTDAYRDAEDGDGIFSGFDAEHKKYSNDSWVYEGPTAEHPEDVVDAGVLRPGLVAPRVVRRVVLEHDFSRCDFQELIACVQTADLFGRPSAVSSTLPGVRSRCTIPRWWA